MAYTVIQNEIMKKEFGMSNAALGLHCKLLSLGPNWSFSIEGLISICKEGETAIRNQIKELIKFGLVEKISIRNEFGVFVKHKYLFYPLPLNQLNPHVENPQVDNIGYGLNGKKSIILQLPNSENPHVENPQVDNQGQVNTNLVNNKKEKISKEKKSFIPPTLKEVTEYCLLKNYPKNLASKIFDY